MRTTLKQVYRISRPNRVRRCGERRGTTIVVVAILLPVVLAIATYLINVCYMELARTELQITTDVATRAAGRTLAVTGDRQEAIRSAERFMALNPFANQKMTLSGSDVVFGVSTRTAENQRYVFANGNNPNAVMIKANGKQRVPLPFPTLGLPIDFRPIKTSISTQTELDVSLVIDRSGSMAYAANEISGRQNPAAAPAGWDFGKPVPPKSRWLDAVNAVNGFLDLLSQTGHEERVGLASYSDKSKEEVKLTTVYSEIQAALAAHTNKFQGGATNIGDGILTGAKNMGDKKTARPWATRVMIVLTDGIHNTGTDPIYAANQAASEKILIYTITFSTEADVEKMKQVAGIGSGKHFHATNGTELTEAFEEIAKSLPTLITF